MYRIKPILILVRVVRFIFSSKLCQSSNILHTFMLLLRLSSYRSNGLAQHLSVSGKVGLNKTSWCKYENEQLLFSIAPRWKWVLFYQLKNKMVHTFFNLITSVIMSILGSNVTNKKNYLLLGKPAYHMKKKKKYKH